MQLKSISITIFAVLINVLGDGYIIPLPHKVESSNITQLNKNNYRITSFSFAKNIFFEYLTELKLCQYLHSLNVIGYLKHGMSQSFKLQKFKNH